MKRTQTFYLSKIRKFENQIENIYINEEEDTFARASLLGPAFCCCLFVVLPDYFPNLSLMRKLLHSN